MGSATSVADSPRLTAFGASFDFFELFLPGLFPAGGALLFLAAMVVTSAFVAEDDAGSACVREIGPRPVDEQDEPVAKPDEEEYVDEQPEPPRRRSREPELRQLHDRRIAADRRERAVIPIVERRRVPARQACADVLRRTGAHLLRGRGDAGHRHAILLDAREVA